MNQTLHGKVLVYVRGYLVNRNLEMTGLVVYISRGLRL